MLIQKTLLISLSLLAFTACKVEKKKKNGDAPTTTHEAGANLNGTVKPGTTTPAGGHANGANQNPVKPTTPVQTGKGEVNQSAPSKGDKGDACDVRVLNFEKRPDGKDFVKGERIKDQYSAYGVKIVAHKRLDNGQMETDITPVLFDSATQPTEYMKDIYKAIDNEFGNGDGFDTDLLTIGNGRTLIIPEYGLDGDNLNTPALYPDDNARGGVIKLYFARPAKVLSFDTIDFEDHGSSVQLQDKANATTWKDVKSTQNLPASANGELVNVTLKDSSFSDKLMINLAGSGAVDNIKLCIKK